MGMLAFLLAITIHQTGPGIDSVAVYSAILTQVRSEFPGRPIALAESRSDVECMPLCGAGLHDPNGPAEATGLATPGVEHSPALLAALKERKLVDATCVVPERTFGCAEREDHLFVALGEITATPPEGPEPIEGGLWVKAAFLVPPTGSCAAPASDRACIPDAFGYWYLLHPQPDGTWIIVRRAPSFVV
jgi:hypothetical protein